MGARSDKSPWDLCVTEGGCVEYLIGHVSGDTDAETLDMRKLLTECFLNENPAFAVGHPLGFARANHLFFRAFQQFRRHFADLHSLPGVLLESLKAVGERIRRWEQTNPNRPGQADPKNGETQ